MEPFLDLLGLGDNDWKVKPLIKVFPQGWGFGTFGPRVFGDPYKKVRAIFDSGKPSFFRLQLLYSKAHKFPTEKYMQQELPRWNELALIYGKPIFISPCCEYEENDRDLIHERMTLAQNLCPNCAIVQSPGRLNDKVCPTFPDWEVEEHGNRARNSCTFFSCDGENAFDMCDQMTETKGIESLRDRLELNGCKKFGLWGARFNLLEAHNTYDSLHRIAPPEPAYVVGVARLWEKRPAMPAPMFDYEQASKPRLLKTWAEDQQGDSDPRENNPCYMTPVRKNKPPRPYVDMVSFDGQRVARLSLFKDSSPARKTDRYYFDKLYAWQLADKAIAMSGSPFVWIDEGKKFGPFCLPFRDPFFQVPK